MSSPYSRPFICFHGHFHVVSFAILTLWTVKMRSKKASRILLSKPPTNFNHDPRKNQWRSPHFQKQSGLNQFKDDKNPQKYYQSPIHSYLFHFPFTTLFVFHGFLSSTNHSSLFPSLILSIHSQTQHTSIWRVIKKTSRSIDWIIQFICLKKPTKSAF